MTANKKRKNLVLGGGLLGSHLVVTLEEKGEEVKVLDRKSGHDLRMAESFLNEFEWADRVWFVAWDVGAWKQQNSADYEIDIFDSNLRLCQSVFRTLQKTKKPFLFVSTHIVPDMNTLAVSKRVGEWWTKLLDGHIARLWNVYGWEPIGEKSHLIPDLVWKGFQGKIELMSNGEETRQFLYVRDCAEALIHQMEIGQKYAEVTSGESISIKTIAQMIGQKLGAEVVLGEKPGRPTVHFPQAPLASWSPRFSIEAGLDETIKEGKAWSQNNR